MRAHQYCFGQNSYRWGNVVETVLIVTQGARCHSFTQVPVIVAEIGAQSVDIQDQSHGAAQQFCKHLSLSNTRGGIKTKKKQKKVNQYKIIKMQSETGRSSESRSLFPLSPRLCQGVSVKTSPFPPPSSSPKCTKWIIHRSLSS